jgi:hypothetical protein
MTAPLDRRAVMLDAHRQFRLMRRHGWSWSSWFRSAAKPRKPLSVLRLEHRQGAARAAEGGVT